METEPKFLSVVGARPQFIKLAPIIRSFGEHTDVRHQVVHTGQHYDDNMSARFFRELEMPTPDIDLGVGSGSPANQIAAMLTGLENTFMFDRPSAVLIYGDTNSTLAAAVAAAKLHIPIAHIEAGLRSFNRQMPEELNRVIADNCSDRLYAPTPRAMQNLSNEQLESRALLTGDVMCDAVQFNVNLSREKSTLLGDLGLQPDRFGLVTVHRQSNTELETLRELMANLESAAEQLPLIFPVHPRTRAMLDALQYIPPDPLRLIEPLSYLDNIAAIAAARAVITDSGGMQKEAAFLRTPCLTLRNDTEWTETVDIGVNVLVGNAGTGLCVGLSRLLEQSSPFDEKTVTKIARHYGDGDAARKIVADCIGWVS